MTIGCKVCTDVSISNDEGMKAHLATPRHILNDFLHRLDEGENLEVDKKVIVRVVPIAPKTLTKKKLKKRKGRFVFSMKLNEKLVASVHVENKDKKNSLFLTEVSRLYPCPVISISDAQNICGTSKAPSPKFVSIAPNSSYVINVTADCASNGMQICPIHFRMKRSQNLEDTTGFSIIRELGVNVSLEGRDIEEKEEEKEKSPYQCDKWPLMKKTVPKAVGRPLTLIPVPKDIKKLLRFDLKPSPNLSMEERMFLDKLLPMYKKGLTRDNYEDFFRYLLFMEVHSEVSLMEKYNMTDVGFKFYGKTDARIVIEVPGLEENRPSVTQRDGVFVCVFKDGKYDDIQYEGEVVKVQEKSVIIDNLDDSLIERLDRSLYEKNPLRLCIRFVPSHYCTNVRISSVELVKEMPYLYDILFPEKQKLTEVPAPSAIAKGQVQFVNRKIVNNLEQMSAILNIVNATSVPAPYIIVGPPGSGKTVCIVEAVFQLMLKHSGSRILVCTQSNAACDHIARTFFQGIAENKANRVGLQKIQAIRFFARSRENVPLDVPHTNMMYTGDANRYNVTFSTLVNAVRLARIGAKYSHVFIDESGQALEPEALTGFMSVHEGGQVVLAGDPQQLGPISMSINARDLGLGTSFLERLTKTVPLYQKKNGVYDFKFITMLKECYRCHPRIIDLSNRLFYDSQLRCKNTPDPLSNYCFKTGQLEGGSALIVHGIIGQELTQGKSPSFYNEQEVQEIMAYVSKMLDPTFPIPVKKDEVGIISPYARQVARIRREVTKRGWEGIMVGTVELFQGQERRVTIISTVRSQTNMMKKDSDFKLGFVNHKRRFNVMMTRASAKNIVIGNPVVLGMDEMWKMLIVDSMNKGYYMGTPVQLRDDSWVEKMLPQAQNIDSILDSIISG